MNSHFRTIPTVSLGRCDSSLPHLLLGDIEELSNQSTAVNCHPGGKMWFPAPLRRAMFWARPSLSSGLRSKGDVVSEVTRHLHPSLMNKMPIKVQNLDKTPNNISL